jgi:DNA transformation protein
LAPFSYMARGRTRALMSYWRAPDRLYDDSDELAAWARAALAAAHRSGQAKARTRTKRKSRR